MQVSIRIPPGKPLPELAAFAAKCEDAGFFGVGVPDHHHVGRDSYLVLSAMAMATRNLTLFPATSNVVTRHPLVLASLLNSLYELSGGRTFMTVAPGFLSVEKAGEPRARRRQLGEAVLALRSLLTEGSAQYGDHQLGLDNRPGEGGKVIVLASGPKTLELAGEVGDGVMMLVGLDPAGIAAARERVRAGALAAGRDPESIEEIFIVPIGLGDQEAVRAWPRSWFRPGHPWLHYPSNSNIRWLSEAGIEFPDPLDPESISDELADRICDAFGLFGSPEHCAERLLRAREEAGVERVFFFPAHTFQTHYVLPHEVAEAFGSVIGPKLEAAGAGWR